MTDETLTYLRDFDPQTVHEVPKGTPFAIYISVSEEAPDGVGYVPAVVYENVAGYFPLSGPNGDSPWVWGPSYDEAKEQAREYNTQLGITPDRAFKIIASSMTMARSQGK